MTKKHKAHDDDADVEAETPTTMIDLAKSMDAAMREVEIRRQSVEVARVTLDTATQEYAAAVDTVNALHTQYEAIMQNVLSHGGTMHIAKP